MFSPDKPLVIILSHSDRTINSRLERPFNKYRWEVIMHEYNPHAWKDNPITANQVIEDINSALAPFPRELLKALIIESNLGRSTELHPLNKLTKNLILNYPDVQIFLFSGTEEYEAEFREAKSALQTEGFTAEQLDHVSYANKVSDWSKLSAIAKEFSKYSGDREPSSSPDGTEKAAAFFPATPKPTAPTDKTTSSP